MSSAIRSDRKSNSFVPLLKRSATGRPPVQQPPPKTAEAKKLAPYYSF